jgi:hypothetical protein
MAGFVYIWFDRKHKRFYVGAHWGSEDDGYICSSVWMRRAYARRPQDFRRRIISRVERREDLANEEQRWLNMMKAEELRGPRYYNIRTDSSGLFERTDSIRDRISEGTKLAMSRPEVRARYEEGLKTRVVNTSPETIEKRRVSIAKMMETRTEERSAEVGNSIREGKRLGKKNRNGETYVWWTNGIDTVGSMTQPGPEWKRGRQLNCEHRKTNEYRQSMAESVRASWRDPEIRKKRLENRKSRKGKI